MTQFGQYIPQIITGSFTLLGVLLGFMLQQYYKRYESRQKMKQEFLTHKLGILTETVSNNLSPKLLELKRFLLNNPLCAMVNACYNRYGFHRHWLLDPPDSERNDTGFDGYQPVAPLYRFREINTLSCYYREIDFHFSGTPQCPHPSKPTPSHHFKPFGLPTSSNTAAHMAACCKMMSYGPWQTNYNWMASTLTKNYGPFGAMTA
jgi:hypothetical protein